MTKKSQNLTRNFLVKITQEKGTTLHLAASPTQIPIYSLTCQIEIVNMT